LEPLSACCLVLSCFINSIQSSILSVSKFIKFNRPPGSAECGSREKYTSLASDPPIYGCLVFWSTWLKRLRETYINSYMAHNGCMIRKSNVLCVITTAVGTWTLPTQAARLLIDDKCPFNIDLDRSGVDDGAVYFGSICSGPRSSRSTTVTLTAVTLLRCFCRHGVEDMTIDPERPRGTRSVRHQ
jgi:hypothetical protein